MEITGSQKVTAPQQTVFNALFDTEVLKQSIPGCESAEYVDLPSGRELKIIIKPNMPGLSGPYTTFIRTSDVSAPSHLVLITEPYNALGTIKATCAIDLAEDGDATNLTYDANAVLEGKIAATPELIIRNTVKFALDQFFKNFEKQVGNHA